MPRKVLIRSADGAPVQFWENGRQIFEGEIVEATVNGDMGLGLFDGFFTTKPVVETPDAVTAVAEGPSGLSHTMVREDPDLDRGGRYDCAIGLADHADEVARLISEGKLRP